MELIPIFIGGITFVIAAITGYMKTHQIPEVINAEMTRKEKLKYNFDIFIFITASLSLLANYIGYYFSDTFTISLLMEISYIFMFIFLMHKVIIHEKTSDMFKWERRINNLFVIAMLLMILIAFSMMIVVLI